MRVDYTLPLLEPERLPELPAPDDGAITFRDQLQGQPGLVPTDWQQGMRLDLRPQDATHLDPPARPTTMDIRDPLSESARWRGMLTRHSKSTGGASGNGLNDKHSVQVMLDMLLDMQQAEDSIVSQSSALTRG